jgi:peptide/nickel transport system permease protein
MTRLRSVLGHRWTQRLARSVFVVWVAMSLVFVLTNLIGDPAVATLGPRAHASQIAEFRAAHGLDRPFHEQYLSYFGGMLRGDLGRSFRDDQPVLGVVLVRLPRTILLGSLAMTFELLFGLGVGLIAALRRNTALDTLTMSLAFLGISTPSFLIGLVLLQVVAFRLGWLPVGGYGVTTAEHLEHALLPAITLAVVGAATYARILRSEMIETLRADYVRTARSKGLSRARVVFAHALRNAALPIVTLVGMSMPLLVGGAIVTETVFGWPGIGRLAMEAVYALDVPVLLGVVLMSAITVQAGNLMADVAVSRIDRRVKTEDDLPTR